MAKKTNKKPLYHVSKEEVLEFLSTYTDRSFTLKSLAHRMRLADRRSKNQLSLVLEQLGEEGQIVMLRDGSFALPSTIQEYEGQVDHVNERYAYIKVPELEEDIWVSTDDLNFAFHGDRVKVLLMPGRRKRQKSPEGEVVEILGRATDTFVGKLSKEANLYFVQPDNRKIYVDFLVPKNDLKGAKTGHKVRINVQQWPSHHQDATAKLLDYLGPAGENEVEMHAILAEYNLPYHFPKEIEAAAAKIPEKLPASAYKKRRDMRQVPTFTIDPFDAKDFDDALSVQLLESGRWEIGIHIADVTHYVTEDSKIEEEARQRATSVYLVDRVVPMLPEKLSNGVCSLRPNEDKLTFSAIFEMDPNGKVFREWFGRTVIHSDQRFAYEDAQEVLDRGKGPMAKELDILNQTAKNLREARFRQGAINFEMPEVKFRLDDKGKPLEVIPKERVDAHKLVEEFMLLANQRVARFVAEKVNKGKEQENTFVYRVHETPDKEKLSRFSRFAQRFGYSLDPESKNLPQQINSLIDEIEGTPQEDLLGTLAIRTMAKAHYTTENIGHFGLALEYYTHFTSPIRRYPDMMVHRMLQHYLDKGKPLETEPWQSWCEYSSEMERRAVEAERASIKYKQVEYIQLQDPDREWEGIISGITDWGFFVEIIENKCEGMIRLTTLEDDFYELDQENYRLVGRNHYRIFAFGDNVKVRVTGTDLERRNIDMLLVEGSGKKASPKVARNRNQSSGGNKRRRKRK